MADIFSKKKRSWVMSRIKGKNTSIEIIMENLLLQNKWKYEKHPDLPGHPDFLLKQFNIIIFCDGDFWHGFNYLSKKRLAKKFWRDKIETNMKRDLRITRKLRNQKWSVLRFWEHDLNKKPEKCERKIIRSIAI